jgi:hypothetical protein
MPHVHGTDGTDRPMAQHRAHDILTSRGRIRLCRLRGGYERVVGRMDEIDDCSCFGRNPNCMHCGGTGMLVRKATDGVRLALTEEPTDSGPPHPMPPSPTRPPGIPDGPGKRHPSLEELRVFAIGRRLAQLCHAIRQCPECGRTRGRLCHGHRAQSHMIRAEFRRSSASRTQKSRWWKQLNRCIARTGIRRAA